VHGGAQWTQRTATKAVAWRREAERPSSITILLGMLNLHCTWQAWRRRSDDSAVHLREQHAHRRL